MVVADADEEVGAAQMVAPKPKKRRWLEAALSGLGRASLPAGKEWRREKAKHDREPKLAAYPAVRRAVQGRPALGRWSPEGFRPSKEKRGRKALVHEP